MNPATLSGVAVALALDACSVTLGVGVALGGLTRRQTFRLVWHFALFQALMPVLGWTGGRFLEDAIRAWDHWLAFGLLVVVGGRMIADGLGGDGSKTFESDPTRGWSLVVLSVATSIDAMAVGLTIALLDQPISGPALIIGVTTAVMTLAAAVLATRVRLKSARRAGILGGAILIFLGCSIVVRHVAGG